MAHSTTMQSWSNLQARRGSVAPFRAAARPTRHQLSNYRCRAAAAAVPSEAEVVVVGAGIAGLSAAANLSKQGIKPLVIDSSDGVRRRAPPAWPRRPRAVPCRGAPAAHRSSAAPPPQVGGRVRTDVVDGFILDRGFQIFLTGYPEAQALLDYGALDLKPFYAGALVWTGSSFERVADPVRWVAGARWRRGLLQGLRCWQPARQGGHWRRHGAARRQPAAVVALPRTDMGIRAGTPVLLQPLRAACEGNGARWQGGQLVRQHAARPPCGQSLRSLLAPTAGRQQPVVAWRSSATSSHCFFQHDSLCLAPPGTWWTGCCP
jgi:hypothetical protein